MRIFMAECCPAGEPDQSHSLHLQHELEVSHRANILFPTTYKVPGIYLRNRCEYGKVLHGVILSFHGQRPRPCNNAAVSRSLFLLLYGLK